MPDISKIGFFLAGLGLVVLAFGRFAEYIFRAFIDKKIETKETQASEANKNTVTSLSEYQRLKRQYDEEQRNKK